MRGQRKRLRVSLVHLSLSQSRSSLSGNSLDERQIVSFGVSHRRRLCRYLSSATSRWVAHIGDLSLGGSPGGDRALSRWLFRNRKVSVCWFCLSVGLLVEALCRFLKSKLSPEIERKKTKSSSTKGSSNSGLHGKIRGTSHTPAAMEVRKPIVCGLSARGMIPPPGPQEDSDDEVVEISDEVVEISDEEEADVVELSSDEYKRNMGYFIRVEEAEEDIEPGVRRLLQRMHEEEKKLREEKFKAMKAGIKLEEGESSKVDVSRDMDVIV
ncbi:hypothetical protein YC2023_105664 [Brassica napus]